MTETTLSLLELMPILGCFIGYVVVVGHLNRRRIEGARSVRQEEPDG